MTENKPKSLVKCPKCGSDMMLDEHDNDPRYEYFKCTKCGEKVWI
jgi:ribosomal protein S27AE